MNINEMNNKITIFYDNENIIKLVAEGLAECKLYNKLVIDKDDCSLSIQDLINKRIDFKKDENPSFFIC